MKSDYRHSILIVEGDAQIKKSIASIFKEEGIDMFFFDTGESALEEIKNDPDLRRIPVVVLTTSKAEEDIICSYNLGVSGFITKPVTFKGLVEAIKALRRYWFEIVELPL